MGASGFTAPRVTKKDIMAYEFQSIDISVFDFHLTLDPLLNPALLNAGYNFLADPVAYNQQYSAGKSASSGNLNLKPLKWRSLTYHHYWKYYQTIWPTGTSYDFWKLQMPYIGKFATQNVQLETNSANFNASVSVILFVTAVGFSTNINILLRGKMSPADVEAYMGQLMKKGAVLFKVNGKSKSLPQVFEYFAELLRKELYVGKVVDILRINKHSVMTLSSFTGPLEFYSPTGKNHMSAADRGAFHAMLKGTPVSALDLVNLENQKQFLLTKFSDTDFAISYFDIGSLVFMQDIALDAQKQGRAAKSKMRCHSKNIRNYLLTTLSLYNFYRDSKKEAAQNAKVKSLRDDVAVTLQEIPKHYTNPFCKSFHDNFKPLAK